MKKAKIGLLLVAVVLVCSTLLTFTLTSKKVVSFKKTEMIPNPDNLLMNEELGYYDNISMLGIEMMRNTDGSYSIWGKSDKGIIASLTKEPLNYLENGKTYTLSTPGSDKAGSRSYTLVIHDVTANMKYAACTPEPPFASSGYVGPTFVYNSTHEYQLKVWVPNEGCVIDDVLYPCLVEGSEPGEFYIEKMP